MNMKLEEAISLVEDYLKKSETEMNNFGSARPGYVNSNIKLVIMTDQIQEYEFGWVFLYNSEKYLKTKDFNDMLVGNAPLIVDRNKREIIVTGTAHNADYYINNYINTGNPQEEA